MEEIEYRLAWHRGKLAVTWYEGGQRFRRSLGTTDQATGKAMLEEFAKHRAVKQDGGPLTVAAIYLAYEGDRKAEGKSISRIQDAWKRLAPAFGTLLPAYITKKTCRDYISSRAEVASRGTIHLELTYLRAALSYAEKEKWLAKAPHIHVPTRPKPRDHYLTKPEATELIGAAATHHLKLFITLALATAARASALLELRWDQVNMKRRTIDLRDPAKPDSPKGRAVVPINDMAFKALEQAYAVRLTPYVIEFAGKNIESVKKGVSAAAARAGLKATPHVLRHSAAVWMAESGVQMEEIAQYLGHTNATTTYRVYARYSPEHLRKASKALEL